MKSPTELPAEYSDYANIFSPDLVIELHDNTRINDHNIQLIEDKKPPYSLIYSMRLIELETSKINIKTHLKTRFIRSSKFLGSISIFFDRK